MSSKPLFSQKSGVMKHWADGLYGKTGNFTVKNTAGYNTGLFGGISISFLRYVGLPEDYALIPGAPLLITLTISAVSTLGIIYAIMRKKKLK